MPDETRSRRSMPDVSRRTLLQASAWSVPVLAVAVSAPNAAASVAGATLTPTVNRNSDDGSFRDYRVDFVLTGPDLPAVVNIEWIPADTTTWGLFDQSVNLAYLSGDFTSGAIYQLATPTASFWLQTTTPVLSGITPYTVRAVDPATSTVIATVTLTFTGNEPVDAD
ncbi:hypothetical protein SRABI76_00791 [Microbacterium oxydans]|uniref:Uncharacterized protein n=1 Tax=Microbacterium oxydans TaxID=82380 RepID=A0A0F0LE64_9MICO|nr:hypothetical protein [Microbacterium oxydans]KJL29821.1 hypothetical protein RS83_01391 [Microbacterium oxydans]CAH0150977.1 hypothetical protein SRABI76_00791 [Microbacterium oxydans]